MIVLDTDHLTAYAFPESSGYQALSTRIRNSAEEFATTIVCLEEQLRGWLAAIKRKRNPSDQVAVYNRLGDMDVLRRMASLAFRRPCSRSRQESWQAKGPDRFPGPQNRGDCPDVGCHAFVGQPSRLSPNSWSARGELVGAVSAINTHRARVYNPLPACWQVKQVSG